MTGFKKSDYFIVLRGRESRSHGEGSNGNMGCIKETRPGHVGPVKSLQTSLYSIEMKAVNAPEHRFENLYGMLNKWNLGQSWTWVNKCAASGIDRQSAHQFGRRLEAELNELESQLKTDRYHARGIRRTHIDKADGGKRPLGIPTVRDKLLQTLCSRILESIWEPEFIATSFGYRRGKGPKDASRHLREELHRARYTWIVEADIKGFFDHIDHEQLLKMLEQRISDKRFTGLIRKWLKAGIMETGQPTLHPTEGTVQGGTISPILANIYLHNVLDEWFEKVVKQHIEGESHLVRYADDFVCAFRYKSDAERFMKALGKRMEKFGLELAPGKTRLLRFSRFASAQNSSFDFLGFTYRWETSRNGKDIVTRKTSAKRLRKTIQNTKQWIREHRDCRLRKLFELLNQKLRGYYNYYGIIGNSKQLSKYHGILMKLLYKWLNRRSQRKSFNWPEFLHKTKWYGLIKPYIVPDSTQMNLFA